MLKEVSNMYSIKSKEEKLSSKKEENLIYIAKKAWERAIREFYYPPLEEPNFIFDFSHRESFYIDPQQKWKITMNLAHSPVFKYDWEYEDYYFAILLHEVSHYQVIPYDGLTNAKLLRAAMKHVSASFSSIVVNIFADLVIDYRLFQKFPRLMEWELFQTWNNITHTAKSKSSGLFDLLIGIYEKMWNVKINVKSNQSATHNRLVERISNLVLSNFENQTTWEEKVRKIAYHLRSIVNDSFSIIGKNTLPRLGNSVRYVEGTDKYVEIPNDVLELLDNPTENRNIDKIKRENRDRLTYVAEQYAKDSQYSEFGSPAALAGILCDGYPLAMWYRGKAKDLLRIEIFEKKITGKMPIYTETWKLGDPFEELDITQTLLNSQIIVPNITTRKWHLQEGIGIQQSKTLPDLLVVIDSSGSMRWNFNNRTNKGQYHIALIAAFAALHFASRRGVKFGIINFSGLPIICDWTYDFNKAERVLLKYQGSGTVLPTKKIEEMCRKSENSILIMIITDFGIYNWVKTKNSMNRLVLNGHQIVGFFIGSEHIPKTKFKDFSEKIAFYPIKNPKELINLVIREVTQRYSPI